MVFSCERCPYYASSYASVVNHIGKVHSQEPNFKVVCGIEGCPNVYGSYKSYRQHLNRKHSEFIKTAEVYKPCSGSDNVASDTGVDEGPSPHSIETTSDETRRANGNPPTDDSPEYELDEVKRHLMLFF